MAEVLEDPQVQDGPPPGSIVKPIEASADVGDDGPPPGAVIKPLDGNVVPDETPKSAPMFPQGELRPHTPSRWQQFKEDVDKAMYNTAPGRAIESSMPRVADAMGIHSSESESNPDAQQHAQQLIAPEYLQPEVSALDRMAGVDSTRNQNRVKGVLKGLGGMTSGVAMATLAGTAAGAAATAGLVNPASATILHRLVSGGFTFDMLHSLYQQNKEYRKAVDSGDTAHAQQIQGEMGLTGVMALMTGAHSLHGVAGRPTASEAELTKEAVQHAEEAHPEPLEPLAEGEEPEGAPAGSIIRPIKDSSRGITAAANADTMAKRTAKAPVEAKKVEKHEGSPDLAGEGEATKPAPSEAEAADAGGGEKKAKYDYGNTQANIPEGSEASKALAKARDLIDPEDLQPSTYGGNEKGLELDPHVTVRYGIQGDDIKGIADYLSKQPPFEAKLGKISSFPGNKNTGGGAVIKADIEAPELHRMNAEIEKHGDFKKSDFPDYVPHATIAYVKPEAVSKYVGKDVTAGHSFKIDKVAISDRNGNLTEVHLKGEPEAAKPQLVKGTRVKLKDGSTGRVEYYNEALGRGRVTTDAGKKLPNVAKADMTPIEPDAIRENGTIAHDEAQRNDVQARSQADTGVDKEAGGDASQEVRQRGTGASGAGKESTQEDRKAKGYNTEKEQHRESVSERRIHSGDDSAGAKVRASGGDGEGARSKAEKERARSSQEPRQAGQPSGESRSAEAREALEAPLRDNANSGDKGKESRGGEGSRREVVEALREMHSVRNHEDEVRVARKVRELQREGASLTAAEQKEIDHALRFESPASVFPDSQANSGEAGSERGRVEPGEQGPEGSSGARVEPEVERSQPRVEGDGKEQKEVNDDLQKEDAEARRAVAGEGSGEKAITSDGKRLGPEAGSVGRVSLKDLSVDPKRFQYKLNTDASGATNKLKDVPWNDALSGIITAWRDPADGKTYVVNGHHRYDLARRHGVKDMAVRVLPDTVKDAPEARIVGAMQNIAEGNGTAVDAAKFMRDTGYTAKELDKYGISLSGHLAEGGTALAQLDQRIFDDVVSGRIAERRGIAIGRAADTPEHQDALLKLIDSAEAKGKTVTNATIEELGRMVKGAGVVATKSENLFGTEDRTQSLVLEKAELSSYIRNQLATEKKLFGSLTSETKAGKLAEGKNKIDTKTNKSIAEKAEQAQEFYDRLSTRKGAVDDILENGAERIAKGENATKVKDDTYKRIRTAIREALTRGPEEAGPDRAEDTAGSEDKGPTREELEAAGQKPMFKRDESPTWYLKSEKPLFKDKTAQEAMRGASRVATAARAEVIPADEEYGHAPMLTVNTFARELLNHIDLTLRDGGKWSGVTLPKGYADQVLEGLDGAAKDMHSTGQARQAEAVEALRDQIEASRDDQGNLVMIHEDDLEHTVGEEQFHSYQTRKGAGLGDVSLQMGQNPEVRKAQRYLEKQGYPDNPTIALLEATAKAANGDWKGAGLNVQEAATMLNDFFDAMVKARGPEVLDDVPRMAEEMQSTLEEARKRHGREAKVSDVKAGETAAQKGTGTQRPKSWAEVVAARRGIQEWQVPGRASSESGSYTQQSLFQRRSGRPVEEEDKSETPLPIKDLIAQAGELATVKTPIARRIELSVNNSVGHLTADAGAVYKAMAASKGVIAGLWDIYIHLPEWTDFKDILGKFLGKMQAEHIRLAGWADELKRTVPDKDRRIAMTNWVEANGDKGVLLDRAQKSKKKDVRAGYELATKLTPEEVKLARTGREYFSKMLDAGKDAGLLEQGVEDYIMHIHEPDSATAQKIKALVNFSELNPNPSIIKERVFKSYFDAEQAGEVPKDKDFGFLVSAYQETFANAIESRAFIRALLENGRAKDGRPLASLGRMGKWAQITPADEPYVLTQPSRPEKLAHDITDYRFLDHPALRNWLWELGEEDADAIDPKLFEDDAKALAIRGDLLLHPEIFKHVENVLGRSRIRANKFGKAALDVSNLLKQSLLSFSGFHQTQETVHGTEHLVNPMKMVKLDPEKKVQMDLLNHGLMVADFDGQQAFSEGVSSTALKYIPIIGDYMARYQHYLFHDYIPRMKMTMALHALDRNRIRFKNKLTDDQILEMTANQSNAAFGGLNYKMMGRSPTFQDGFRLLALAPDFLEARARFVGQALTPYGKEQRVALIRGALVMYAGARILNSILNDGDAKWNKADAFRIVYKGRRYGLRTVQGDILNAIEDPILFMAHRLNPMTTRPFIELVTKRDEFGRQKSLKSQAKDFAKGAVPIPVQGRMKMADTDWTESILNAMGLETGKYYTPAETLARKKRMENIPDKPEDPDAEKVEESHLKYQMTRKLREGKATTTDLWNLVNEGKLSAAEAKRAQEEGEMTELQTNVKAIGLSEALDVYAAAGPAERADIEPIIQQKRANFNQDAKHTDRDREKIEAKLEKLKLD